MAGPDRFRNLQTDLFCTKRDFIGPKKNVHYGHICNEICRNDNGCVVFFQDRSKHSQVLIQYPVITHMSSH